MIIWICVCVNLGILHNVQSVNPRCTSIVTPDFSLCRPDIIQDLPDRPCQDDIDICSRGFNISFVRIEPFTHTRFKTFIKQIITHCCGSCNNTKVVNYFNNMTEVSPFSINSSHIVYPILGRVDATSLYEYNFVPFWNAPGAYYITTRRTKEMVMNSLLISCGNVWPLLIVMLLMALIAGFIVWIIETWVNKEMFSRTFLVGLLDGFWWSFVSMTTVGYGDKIPKFLAARLFSVIWILVGITICSMFTASLTTEIAKAVSSEKPHMMGKTVGVLKQRIHDLALVAKHGGIINETKGLDMFSDVIELIDKLKNRKINGFLLDKFAYGHAMHYFDSLNETSNYTDHRKYFLNDLLLTEKTYEGDKLTFGILLKEREDYDFLRLFIMDNQLSVETCTNIALNMLHNKHRKIDSEEEYNIFSPERGLFTPSIIATCAILGFIIGFGIIYEVARKKVKLSAMAQVHMENGANAETTFSDISLHQVNTK